ncbi:hypothetical protein SDC9_77111 [bioreactor metagenome]|uniref:Uncharacterized protein n=1 Tax=bioreactor metagenome TaxID=1076179 RepID=A0A644YRR2_9ZZZZ
METETTWCICQYMGNEIESEIWKFMGLSEKARIYNDFVKAHDPVTLCF